MHIGFRIQNYFKSPGNKNGFHFILAVIKPFPFNIGLLASGSKITSNLPGIKMDFILAVIKPFPFKFSHMSKRQ